ncbi:MAG: hypothetical protein KDE33_12285 [Bacteroidetes bacterium]|nr:hypothetical protein [Bacteroidota bacterium]MCB9227742.1 hypothetical protein [Chitinophagales bacterium]
MDKKLLDNIIDNYRQMVNNRYEYDYLKNNYELDSSITKELTDEVKLYFLNYVYPDADQRDMLNKAFSDLDKHIKNPLHILKLVGDASGLILKFGFQFPKALKAGLQTLNSFKTARELETELSKNAEKLKLKYPIEIKDVEHLISKIEPKKLENFIDSFDDLLSSLTDTKLLKKTIEIMDALTAKMKLQKDFFSPDEIKAIDLGKNILEAGYSIFKNLDENQKKIMIELILTNERNFISNLQD